MKRKEMQICALLLAGMFLLTTCAANTSRNEAERSSSMEGSESTSALAEPSSSTDTETTSAESSMEEESSAEVNVEPELLATLFFASDYQYKEGWPEPAETLSSLLD
ncbi:MAG: hypothetical protein LUH45_05950, partial [Clostridiales bacterium]|nr:hypothetical protein [Clostridiales bacterium]